MIKSKHVFAFACSFLSALVVCISCSAQRNVSGSSLPDWVDNPSNHYSEADYLMAVGSGSTLKEAQQDALGNLSRIFKAEIDASQELIDEFAETSENGQFSTQQTTELLNVTHIGSQQDLINTQILESEVGPNGTYYALAGMDRTASVRIYSEEISNNELQIEELENNAEDEPDLLQKLVLLKQATMLAEVNENLAGQRNILLRGASDTELNAQTLSRLQEKFRTIKQQVPVAVTTQTASEGITSTVAGVLQQAGFSVAGESYSGEPVLEVNVDYQSQEADLNRPNMEFVKWELIIDIVNKYSERSFKTFMTEGRDGALSQADAVKRADYSARQKIERDFKQYLNKELLAIN